MQERSPETSPSEPSIDVKVVTFITGFCAFSPMPKVREM
jgi:hypothetical protein